MKKNIERTSRRLAVKNEKIYMGISPSVNAKTVKDTKFLGIDYDTKKIEAFDKDGNKISILKKGVTY